MTRFGIAAIAAAAALGAAPATGPAPLTIEIHAREIAPGEPVRIVVGGPDDLVEVSGTFLGRDLAFVREDDRNGDRWDAWGVVDLDRAPGTVAIEARGALRDGRLAAGTRAVEIAAKRFPEEVLEVAPKYVEPPEAVKERLARERARVAAIYALRTPRLAFAPFVRPLKGEPTSIFGTRRLFNGKPRSPHPGLDLRAATGTRVAAAGPGRVVLAADLYYSGNTVILDHGGGLFTLYAHLSRIDVREGREVSAGDVLGLSGATGRVTGPHLHWGAKIGDGPCAPRARVAPALGAPDGDAP